MNEQIHSQARTIAQRLNDEPAIWFHYRAVKLLGFQRCYEFASHALLMAREGKLKTSAARYFNGCVKREIQNKKLRS